MPQGCPTTIVDGIVVGILLWGGFIVTLEAGELIREKNPFRLYAIRIGNHLVAMIVAGAIDHFGTKHGLPKAFCANNSCWTWGTRGYSGEMVLAMGYDDKFLEQYFENVRRIARVKNRYAHDVEICL